MNKKKSTKEKFLLLPIQIEMLKKCHDQIIREGLIGAGIPQINHGGMLAGSAKTFDAMIEKVQKELLSMGDI
ncbi:MAG: hypothetical protein WCO84_02510 [bacterium]